MKDLGLEMLNEDVAGFPPPVEKPVETVVSGYDLVADLLPVAQHKALGAWCVRYKIGEDDPIFGEKLAANVTFSSAAAAAAAAARVSDGVNAIPDKIFQGACKASDEVKGGLVAGAKAFVEAFSKAANDRQAALLAAVDAQQASILSAATVGAEKIKTAATTLTTSLDLAIAAKKNEGVADFAKAAAAAGKAAAEASMWAQISRSAIVSVMAFIFACAVGAGGLWGYLLLNHEVMPAGVIAVSDPLRGPGTLVSIPNGGTPVHDCAGGLCVYYKAQVPDLP